MRSSPISPPAPAQPGSERDEDRSADNGGRTIDRPRKPENVREHGRRDQKHAVGKDFSRRRGASANNGQHWHARTRIIVRASEQQRPKKCGGVHKKMITNRMSGSIPMAPVAAVQPITGGRAPAAPPMTMFWGVRRFSQIVYTTM
jgi:hypothetical protein